MPKKKAAIQATIITARIIRRLLKDICFNKVRTATAEPVLVFWIA